MAVGHVLMKQMRVWPSKTLTPMQNCGPRSRCGLVRGFTLSYQVAGRKVMVPYRDGGLDGATVSVRLCVCDCEASMQAIALAACCARLSPTKKSVALRAIVR